MQIFKETVGNNMNSTIALILFILAGALIGGPAGLVLAGKIYAKKYLLAKFLAGAVVGGVSGAVVFVNLVPNSVSVNGNLEVSQVDVQPGYHTLRMLVSGDGDAFESLSLDYEKGGRTYKSFVLKNDGRSDAQFHIFLNDVHAISEGNIIRISNHAAVPLALKEYILESVRVGGIPITLEHGNEY